MSSAVPNKVFIQIESTDEQKVNETNALASTDYTNIEFLGYQYIFPIYLIQLILKLKFDILAKFEAFSKNIKSITKSCNR